MRRVGFRGENEVNSRGFVLILQYLQVLNTLKNLPAMQETWI